MPTLNERQTAFLKRLDEEAISTGLTPESILLDDQWPTTDITNAINMLTTYRNEKGKSAIPPEHRIPKLAPIHGMNLIGGPDSVPKITVAPPLKLDKVEEGIVLPFEDLGVQEQKQILADSDAEREKRAAARRDEREYSASIKATEAMPPIEGVHTSPTFQALGKIAQPEKLTAAQNVWNDIDAHAAKYFGRPFLSLGPEGKPLTSAQMVESQLRVITPEMSERLYDEKHWNELIRMSELIEEKGGVGAAQAWMDFLTLWSGPAIQQALIDVPDDVYQQLVEVDPRLADVLKGQRRGAGLGTTIFNQANEFVRTFFSAGGTPPLSLSLDWVPNPSADGVIPILGIKPNSTAGAKAWLREFGNMTAGFAGLLVGPKGKFANTLRNAVYGAGGLGARLPGQLKSLWQAARTTKGFNIGNFVKNFKTQIGKTSGASALVVDRALRMPHLANRVEHLISHSAEARKAMGKGGKAAAVRVVLRHMVDNALFLGGASFFDAYMQGARTEKLVPTRPAFEAGAAGGAFGAMIAPATATVGFLFKGLLKYPGGERIHSIISEAGGFGSVSAAVDAIHQLKTEGDVDWVKVLRNSSMDIIMGGYVGSTRPIQRANIKMADKAADKAFIDITLYLSLIHISEPTRPY